VEVTYAAKSASCAACGKEINVNDYEINKPLHEGIATRGNVTINRMGALECERLICHNLRAYGDLKALVEATGEVIIRSRATIPGGLRCEKLLIGREAVVEIDGDVEVDEMQINGTITAKAFVCRGTTQIEEFGAVNGPVTTKSVAMEEGGALNGPLRITPAARR
jgi:cytoskeletal protein CcmA (bactofilin family)